MATFPKIMNGEKRPVAVHAEMTILGACLVEPMAIYEAIDTIISSDFALDSHRRIYTVILELEEEGTAVDIVTVSNRLKSKKELDVIGGVPYIASLSEGLPRKLSIESYVRIVRDKSLARQGMDVCSHFYNEMVDESQEILDIFGRLQESVLDIASGNNNNTEGVDLIGARVIAKIEEERKITSTDIALGYTYGIEGIDFLTKGAYGGEYTVILGETNSGKTAWVTQMIVDNALKGVPCHVFSMEMTREQMYRRMLSPLSKIVTATQIRDPRLMFSDAFLDLKATAAILHNLPIKIDDTRSLPIDQLRARAKVAIRRDKAKIIVADYLQLIQAASGKENVNEVKQISDASIGLRDLAAEHVDDKVHVVALSQYARPSDGSRGRPSNHRAKGSGTIEQSCQVMMHIVREEEEDGSLSDEGEVRIGKLREGGRGSVHTLMDNKHLRLKSVQR